MLTLYAICFGVGLLLTAALTLLGDALGSGPHVHAGSTHDGGASPFSLTTATAFVTGFGGVGLLLTRLGFAGGIAVALLSLVAGFLLAAGLFLFLAKLLLREDYTLKESDFELGGTLATVSIAIPTGGVGEVKFVLAGTTRSIGARAEHGQPIARGAKTIILSHNRGIAIVSPLDEELSR